MSGNGERISIWRGLASILRAPIEERYLRETWARGERLQAEAANRILEQVVRQVEPETDGYVPLTGLYGERQLSAQDTEELREQAIKAWLKQPHARGYIDSLKRFTMGKGPQFIPKVEDDKLKGRLTDWWKQFARLNDWDNLEDEIPVRTWRDGETFVRRFIHGGGVRDLELTGEVQGYLTRYGFDASTALVEEVPAGMVFLRLIPPEQIADPEDVISYGIVTSGADVQTVLGYVWSVEGQVKEIIPAADILHTKIGVDSDVKRGRSALEIILPYEKKYSDWLEYRIALNLARTAVVLFRKVVGTPTQVAQVGDTQETQRETGTNDRRVRMLKPMSTFTHNQGVEYEFKSPNIQASDAQHDGRHILLTMAAAAGLPEYMFTGDASNANYACHDEETEILTRRGWLRHGELRDVDQVATRDAEGHFQWQTPVAVHRYGYAGPLIAIRGMHIDMMVTPNHRLYVQPNRTGEYVFVEAAQHRHAQSHCLAGFVPVAVPALASCVTVPEVGYRTHPEFDPGDRRVDGSDWAAFVGLWVAEGSALHARQGGSGRFMVTISQRDELKVARAQAILDRTPFVWRRSGDHWYTFDKSLWHWLVDNCGTSSRAKHVPRSVLDGSIDVQRAFFEGAMLGDGSRSILPGRTAATYATSSNQLADQMQELALKLGYLCRKTGPYLSTGFGQGRCPVWYLRIRRQVPLTLRRTHFSEQDYEGLVWCVTVPNGLILTRRNGFPAIHGNSTMVSESPAVREFESWQDFFTPTFHHIWSWVMVAAAQHGAIEGLSEDKARDLECEIAWPPMMSRDELQHTQANKARHEGGILSREGWASDDGIDWTVERERLAKELKDALALPPDQILDRLSKIVSSGMVTPDRGLERFIRTMIGAPALRGEEPEE